MLVNLFRSVKRARVEQSILSRHRSLLFLATLLAFSVHAESFSVDFESLHEQEVALPDPLDPEGWTVASEEGDVTISMRSWPDSDFYAIKIDQTFDTNLSNVVGHLLDDSRYKNWIPDLKSARIIRQLDEQKSRSVYMHLEMPWPLDDRDSIIGQRITQNPETLVVTIKEWNEGASLPEKHNVVRSPRINSEYVLIPLSPNKVRSIWQGHQEPGGSVPSFLVNWMIDNIYEESAANMQVQFEDPALKYELEWIADLQ